MSDTLGMLSAAVTDLAARVEALDAGLDGGGSDSGGHLDQRLRTVETVVTTLRATVGKLNQSPTRDDAEQQLRKPWHQLSAEQAEHRWLELRAWVDWFAVRNNIGAKELPACWYLHGGLVDELEALRWAWLETTKPTAKGTDPVWWREALQRARTRWPLFNPNGCAATHTETRPRVMDSSTSKRDWEDFLAEDLANRPADQPARAS